MQSGGFWEVGGRLQQQLWEVSGGGRGEVGGDCGSEGVPSEASFLSSSQEEEKLQTLANSSSLCTSSDGSLSSGITSGYNSSPAFSGHLQSPEVKVSGQT